MTSLISMFGNESWFYAVQNSSLLDDEATASSILTDICSRGLPFMRFYPQITEIDGLGQAVGRCRALAYDNETPAFLLVSITYYWFQTFYNNGVDVNKTLAAALSFSNEALLTLAAEAGVDGARPIYKSGGAQLIKPGVSLVAMVIISVLLGLEVLALVGLTIFIYWNKTFTNRIDAFSAAVMGAQLSAAGLRLPALGDRKNPTLKIFENLDGVVGLSDGYAGADARHDRNSTGAPVRETATIRSEAATAGNAPAYEDIPLRDLEAQAETSNSRPGNSPPLGSLAVGGTGIISGREAAKLPSQRSKLRLILRGERPYA
jgi:hypothetical protein